MESFSDQLKRHDKYFTQLSHHAKHYVDQNMRVQQITQKFAQSIYQFSQGELQHNKVHLQAFGELLQKQAESIAFQLRNIQEFCECFNIKQELQQMKVITQAQTKTVPPFNKEMNLQFIQNAAVYQQNRQRQLKTAMVNLSNAFIGQAAALFETATNLRQQAAAVDDLAPRVDMARRFVHLELEGDICDILGLSKQDFDGYDIRGYLPPPIESVRRGAPRLDEYQQIPQHSVGPKTFVPTSNIGNVQQSHVSLQPGLGLQQPLQGGSAYNPKSPQMEPGIDQQYHQMSQIQQQQLYPQNMAASAHITPPAQPIKNMYIQPNQHMPEYKEEKPQVTRPIDPAVAVVKRYPNVKAYEFGDSLFDDESDGLGDISAQNNAPKINQDSQLPFSTEPAAKTPKNVFEYPTDVQFDDQFQQEQSKYLLEQLSTMQAMIRELTGPNSDQTAGPTAREQMAAASRQENAKAMAAAVAQGGIEDPDAYDAPAVQNQENKLPTPQLE